MTYVANNVNEYTSSTTNGVTTTYNYDNDGNLVGQTTAGSKTTYSYNELDELTGVSGPGQTMAFTYDPLGNQNSETINGATTRFLIDPVGVGDVASTYTNGGSLIAHYTYGYGLTSQVNAAGQAAYYDFGLTGNTIGLTGAAGSYVNKYSYLPFGQTTTVSAALANPFTFVGQLGVIQSGSSLFSMRARDYSPTLGQFLSSDPLGLNGGDVNVRRYVGNSPVDGVDPTGTQDLRYGSPDSILGTGKGTSTGTTTGTTNQKGYAKLFSNMADPKTAGKAFDQWMEGGGYALEAGTHINDSHVHANNASDKASNPTGAQQPAGTSSPSHSTGGTNGSTPQGQPGVTITPIHFGPTTNQKGWQHQSTPVVSPVKFPKKGSYIPNDSWVDAIADVLGPVTDSGSSGETDNGQSSGAVTDAWGDTVNPVNVSVTAGKDYPNLEVATVTVAGDLTGGVWQAWLVYSSTAVPATVSGSGDSLTVTANVDYTYTPFVYEGWWFTAAEWKGVVEVWYTPHTENPQPGGVVSDSVTVADDGTQQTVVTAVAASVVQANAIDPPLAIVDTTDPNITSASQVSVVVGVPPSADSPVPLVTGVTLTSLGNGVTQIVVDGVVSAVQPGAGFVGSAPLVITLAGEAPLTAQLLVDETSSDYTVNPVVVAAVSGQAVQNVQVATVAGPADGVYSATINWGDGDTSAGQITPLGGGLFSVSGSKPNPYTAAGTDTITVTVNEPPLPAPPAEAMVVVSPPTSGLSGTIATATPNLTWAPVARATGYDIYVMDQTTGQNPVLQVADLPATSYQLNSAQALTPGHSYTWYLGAVGSTGAVAWGSPQSFTVAALAAPTLNGPSGAVAVGPGFDSPTFNWNLVSGAAHYYLYVVDASTGAVAIANSDVVGAWFTPSTALTPGHSFIWYVGAKSANGGAIAWSNPGSFTLAPLASPMPIGPVNTTIAASNGFDTPTFSWNSVTGAAHYYLYVLDTTTDQAVLSNPSVTGSSFTATTALTPGHSFTWYVAAESTNGAAVSWSGPQSFTLASLAQPTQNGPSGTIAPAAPQQP